MKKHIKNICFAIIFYNYGWLSKKIQLTKDKIELELGQTHDISQYYKEDSKKDLLAHVTMNDSQVKYETKDDKKYPKVGQYKVILKYTNDNQNKEKEVSVIVKDITALQIKLKEEKIETAERTEIKDWNSYFEITDYDQTTLDFKVTVLKTVLSFKEEITLYEDESQTLKTTQEKLSEKTVYENSQTKIVTVNKDGKIKAISPVKASITVTSGDLKDECQITVKKKKQVTTANPSFQTSQVKKWTLNVPYYNQYAVESPMGCEGASLLEALNYKEYASGYSGNLAAFLSAIPRTDDRNPYHGYTDDPFVEGDDSLYQSIFPSALAPWAAQFGNVVNISGCGISGLQNEIKNGNPVVVYVTYKFRTPQWGNWPFGRCVNNMHVMTLCGYDAANNRYLVADPAPTTKACGATTGIYWVDGNKFANSYNALNWAIAER